MCRLPGVVQHLTQLHEWGVLEAFWSHLLDRLVPAAIKDCRLSITSSSDGGGGDGGELTPGKPEYWSLLESLLSDCTLHDIHAAQIIRYDLFYYLSKVFEITKIILNKLFFWRNAMRKFTRQPQ